jgi:hypothetical protein
MSKLTCIKCGSEATKRYSPDLDIQGIGMCAEHEEEVMLDLLITQFDPKGWEKFEKKYSKPKKDEAK